MGRVRARDPEDVDAGALQLERPRVLDARARGAARSRSRSRTRRCGSRSRRPAPRSTPPTAASAASGLTPGGFEESEKKVKEYRRRVQSCDPVGEFVNDKVHTVNFLSCCEDGDRGRRAGLRVASIFSYMASQLLSAKEVLPTQLVPVGGAAARAAPRVRRPGRRGEGVQGRDDGQPRRRRRRASASGSRSATTASTSSPTSWRCCPSSTSSTACGCSPRRSCPSSRRRSSGAQPDGVAARWGPADAPRRIARHPRPSRRRADRHPRDHELQHRRRRHPAGPLRDQRVRHRGAGAAGAQPDDPARRQLPRVPRARQRVRAVLARADPAVGPRRAYGRARTWCRRVATTPTRAEALATLVGLPHPAG